MPARIVRNREATDMADTNIYTAEYQCIKCAHEWQQTISPALAHKEGYLPRQDCPRCTRRNKALYVSMKGGAS